MTDQRMFKCLDFQQMGLPIGLLVQRSAYFMRDRCVNGRPQIGIITGFEVCVNEDQIPIVWPIIAWEGKTTGPSTTNPALVEPGRAKDRKRAVYIEVCV